MYSLWLMMMFEASKHVPKTEESCFVFKNNYNTCAIKTITPDLRGCPPVSSVIFKKFICAPF